MRACSRPGRRQPVDHRVVRAGTAEVLAHADRPHPRPPPPCGMQKVLCRLRCDDVGAELAGTAETDERVEVGAIEVDLAAVVVHDLADIGGFPSSKTPWVEG